MSRNTTDTTNKFVITHVSATADCVKHLSSEAIATQIDEFLPKSTYNEIISEENLVPYGPKPNEKDIMFNLMIETLGPISSFVPAEMYNNTSTGQKYKSVYPFKELDL